MDADVRQRLQSLRDRCGFSIRQLAERSGVTAGMISCIERGKSSPSLATLQKILISLGTDLASFFSETETKSEGPTYPREEMRSVSDGERSYTIVFPRSPNLHIEMFDEHNYRSRRRPPYEKLQCDVAGYVLSGQLVLDFKGKKKKTLRPGDAFYIPKGLEHRGYVETDEPARLITVYHPAKY
ncbi:MAG: cupin domain-containing protein [Phycisphaerae bacterium]|nr:cupin domain-containing protein [Phycisphaerae bacterium]